MKNDTNEEVESAHSGNSKRSLALWSIAILVLCIISAIGYGVIFASREVSATDCDRVKPGMTHREVAKVLGSRGRNKQLEDWEKDIYKTHGLADLQWREWKITIDQAYRDSDMAGDIPAAFAPPYFRVGFDQTGSVVTTSISRPRKE